jgi:hypothetical protein
LLFSIWTFLLSKPVTRYFLKQNSMQPISKKLSKVYELFPSSFKPFNFIFLLIDFLDISNEASMHVSMHVHVPKCFETREQKSLFTNYVNNKNILQYTVHVDYYNYKIHPFMGHPIVSYVTI